MCHHPQNLLSYSNECALDYFKYQPNAASIGEGEMEMGVENIPRYLNEGEV